MTEEKSKNFRKQERGELIWRKGSLWRNEGLPPGLDSRTNRPQDEVFRGQATHHGTISRHMLPWRHGTWPGYMLEPLLATSSRCFPSSPLLTTVPRRNNYWWDNLWDTKVKLDITFEVFLRQTRETSSSVLLLDTTKPNLYHTSVHRSQEWECCKHLRAALQTTRHGGDTFQWERQGGEERWSLPHHSALTCREHWVDISNHCLFVST